MVAFGDVRRHTTATVRGESVTGPDAARRFYALARIFDSRAAAPALPPSPVRPAEDWSRLGGIIRQTLALGTALAAAALVSILFPAPAARVTDAMATAWLPSVGVGALTGVVALVLAPVLAITCIALPVAIVIVLALGVTTLVGWTGAGYLVGVRVARATTLRLDSPVAETLVGVALISLAAMLPGLGFLAALPVAAWGLGAVVLTRLGARPYVPAPLPASGGGHAGTATRGDTRPLDATPGRGDAP